MTIKVVLVGCGNMGFAMLAGWLRAGRLTASDVFVVEPSETLRARAERLGVKAAADSAELPAGSRPDLIVLAVKPQVIREVSAGYAALVKAGATVLTVAAGTPMATYEAVLGDDAAIIRCMPNTPASIGKGMMVVLAKPNVDPTVLRFAKELLSTSGMVAEIEDETLMDAVTAVSGSGPAYVFHFIEALSAAAEKAGLPADLARKLAMQTVHGAASLAAESEDEPAELRRQVTSPNGTTAAALAVLMGDDRLVKLLDEAVEAARARSVELGKQ